MKYLIHLIGSFDGDNKSKFQNSIVNIIETNPLKLKYLKIGNNNVVIYMTTMLPIVEVKDLIKKMCDELKIYYFIMEHSGDLFMNLNDDDSRHLFADSFVEIEEKKDDELESLFMDFISDDDDDDDDLVQNLKEKYLIKEQEPTLDDILDKITQKGMTSLSIQEKSILNSYN